MEDIQICLLFSSVKTYFVWERNAPRGEGHSTVKNTGGGWLDSLGSEILVGKDILGFFKNTDLDNS